MSYKQFTIRSSGEQMSNQWVNRQLLADVALGERRELKDYLSKFLPPKGRVLEAGCGIGSWVKIMQAMGHDVIGIDWYSEIVQAAHEADATLQIEQGDIRSLRFADATFDAYISLGVVEHFEEGPEDCLKEAYRLLKPGGVALITVPALTIVRKWLAHPFRTCLVTMRKISGRKVYFAEYRYTLSELVTFTEKAGFQIITKGTDDVFETERDYHMGIYCDWPFCRGGKSMQLNLVGKLVRWFCSFLPYSFYAGGIIVVGRKLHALPAP